MDRRGFYRYIIFNEIPIKIAGGMREKADTYTGGRKPEAL